MQTNFLKASALALAISGVAGAQTPVTNTPNYSDAYAFSGFGAGGSPTVGQTFTVPTGDTYLNSFTFYLANDALFGGGSGVNFKPYLMLWAGDHPTGTNLLSLSPVTPGNGLSTYVPYLFTGGVAVTPGSVYVAFLTTSGVTQGDDGYEQFAGSANSYTGGELVYAFTTDASDLTTPANWNSGAGAQLAFNAQFSGAQSTVPEPSEFVLLGSGLSALVGFVRVRRKRATIA